MGVFDYIRCQMPLPQEPVPPTNFEWFQTKDTEDISGQCYMEKWTIYDDGRLVHHKPTYSWEPNENKVGFERLAGALKTISVTDIEHPHHGDLCFYHYDNHSGEWWEYIARFTDGRCTKVWCSEHSPPEATA